MNIVQVIDIEFERQVGAGTAVFFENMRDAADDKAKQDKARAKLVKRIELLLKYRTDAVEALKKAGLI